MKEPVLYILWQKDIYSLKNAAYYKRIEYLSKHFRVKLLTRKDTLISEDIENNMRLIKHHCSSGSNRNYFEGRKSPLHPASGTGVLPVKAGTTLKYVGQKVVLVV